MTQWADFLISEVLYDSNRLIKYVKRHEDSEDGLSNGKIVDRLTVASDIKNGLTYSTIFKGLNSWKKGNKIKTFQIKGTPYIRIDDNKVTFDNLGQISELNIDSLDDEEKQKIEKTTTDFSSKSNLSELREKQMKEKDIVNNDSKQVFKRYTTPEKPPQSPRGSLPKDTGEELPQELDFTPEPVSDSQPEDKSEPEPTPEKPPQSPRGSLPKDTGEELPQELDLAPEPVSDSQPEDKSEPEPTPEKPPQSPRGSLPKDTGEELPQELDLAPEPVSDSQPEDKSEPEPTPEKPPQSPRGSLPKDTGEELPQELDLAPEPVSDSQPEPEDEEATPEQIDQLDDLKKQIDDLEIALSKLDQSSTLDNDTKKQSTSSNSKTTVRNSINKKIQQQNKKLDEIEQKLRSKPHKSETLSAYCMKCKTKRIIKDPKETTMKNGRPAVRGVCSKCGTKVFRITKTK